MRINELGLEEALAELRGLSPKALTRDNYLEVALAIICLGLEVPMGKILQLDPDGRILIVRAAMGWKKGTAAYPSVPATTQSIAGYTLKQTGVVVFDDVMDTKRFSDARLLRLHDVRATLASRIVSKGKPWGALTIHEQVRRGFSSEEVQFLMDAALRLGGLIEAREAQAMEPPRSDLLRKPGPCG